MWNKLRDNVKRLLFKCLRVFMFTRLEASGGVWRHPQASAFNHGSGPLWMWSAGEVRLARWFDLPQLVFHLENTVSKRVSLRDVVF